MSRLITLSSKERKRLIAQLESQYGIDNTGFLKKYVFLLQEKRQRFFIANPDLFLLPLGELRVESMGLYLCSKLSNGELRLSIEGSQLLGPVAGRSVLELDGGEFYEWIRGRDVEKETGLHSFLIIKHGLDYCGSGKPVLDGRSGKSIIHNYVPKTRYVRSE